MQSSKEAAFRGRRLADPAEAANYLNVSTSTLAKWRLRGVGPAFRKVGPKLVRYDYVDLDAFRDAGRRTSTTEAVAAA